MKIGVPKEIKNHEYRVGLTPASVRELTTSGHSVIIEKDAGVGIGCRDTDYSDAGAVVVPDANSVFAEVDCIVKVKEPQLSECAMLRAGQIVFTYLHLAADRAQAYALMKSGCHAIAYETVTAADGSLPLLTPMSEVAGRMSAQVGATLLQKSSGGRGVLMGGVPGVEPAQVLVIGGGVAGTAAAEIALGMRAAVTIIDKSLSRLRKLDAQFGGAVQTLASTAETIERQVGRADLVIGSVLVPGASAPKLVDDSMIAKMRPGSVVVDIAIDQGGCFTTSRPTTHADPTYVRHGVIHYCVTNMPGAVPRTSTFALNAATLPYLRKLADLGLERALSSDSGFRDGLNISSGQITHEAVSVALQLK